MLYVHVRKVQINAYIKLTKTKIYNIEALQKEYSLKLMHSLKLMQLTL